MEHQNLCITLQESAGNNERTYDLYDATVKLGDKEPWILQKRYSEFYDLKLELDLIVPHLSDLFPPKRLIGNRSPENIQERVSGIPNYFNQVIQESEEVIRNQAFREFFGISHECDDIVQPTDAANEYRREELVRNADDESALDNTAAEASDREQNHDKSITDCEVPLDNSHDKKEQHISTTKVCIVDDPEAPPVQGNSTSPQESHNLQADKTGNSKKKGNKPRGNKKKRRKNK